MTTIDRQETPNPQTATFEFDDGATAMFTRRQYRAPFVVPNVSGTTTE